MVMGRNFTKLLALFLAFGTPLAAVAEDFSADGISYNITSPENLTVEVTESPSYSSYAGDITIPATVTNGDTEYTVTGIGGYAFFYCDITSVAMPATVETISEYAFYGCKGLEEVTLPDNLVTIGNSAFGQCSFITSVNIPAKVTSIEGMAFDNCTALSTIYCYAATPPSCVASSFSRVNTGSCTLYIPEGTKEAYDISPWNEFGNIVETGSAGTDEAVSDIQGAVSIYALSGNIIIENAAPGTPLTVYTANGTIFYGGITSETATEISVPAGIYIVKCGKQTQKVIL